MFFSVQLLYAVVLAVFGACIGSFLNVVIYRLPQGISLSNPPSTCPHCGVRIRIYHNIPVIGWLVLRGRGSCCGEKISWRYPAVELLTALLWAAVGWFGSDLPYDIWTKAGIMTTWLGFLSLMIAITFIDIDLQIIPDELSIGGTVGALIASTLLPPLHSDFVRLFPAVTPYVSGLLGSLVGALVGAGVLFIITMIGTVAMRGKMKQLQEEDPEVETAIGFGDIKLMAFVGTVLGWKAALAALLIGTVLGAVFGLIEKLRTGSAEDKGFEGLLQRWRSGVSLIPFGPFICLGALALLFFRGHIFDWLYSYFSPFVIIWHKIL